MLVSYVGQTLRSMAIAMALVLCTSFSLSAQYLSVNPADLVRPQSKFGHEFDEMNRHLTQVHAVKSLSFFKLDQSQRYARLSHYAGHVGGGNVKALASDVSKDFVQGGIVKDVAIAALTSIMTKMAQGATLDESLSQTWSYVSSTQFFVGQLFGGMFGAALGAMVPVPLVGGIAGQIIAGVPMMAGAMFGGTMGYNIIGGFAKDDLDLWRLLKSVDYLNLFFQSVGSTIGMTLGALMPVPGLGAIIGGVIGGNIGMKVALWLRRRAGFLPETIAADEGLQSVPAAASAVIESTRDEVPSAAQEETPFDTLDVSTLLRIRDRAYVQFQAAHASGEHTSAQQYYAVYVTAQRALEQSQYSEAKTQAQ